MRNRGTLLCFSVVLGFGLSFSSTSSCQVAPTPGITPPNDAPDPLLVGKAAMQHGDYASARTFFANYVTENPNDTEAVYYLGEADLELMQYSDAVKQFQTVIASRPEAWGAHISLSEAFAEMQDWADFDKERAMVKAARDAKKPGLSLIGHDLIDVLRVNGKTYEVWYFYTPYGRFHARYVFLHFDPKGKADYYIQCESDDIDQSFFREKHKKQADAGGRSYSLDSYDLGNNGMTQALHQFYMDGEPTYETVRADVVKILSSKSKPEATATTPAK